VCSVGASDRNTSERFRIVHNGVCLGEGGVVATESEAQYAWRYGFGSGQMNRPRADDCSGAIGTPAIHGGRAGSQGARSVLLSGI
jgi:hypothetical protein